MPTLGGVGLALQRIGWASLVADGGLVRVVDDGDGHAGLLAETTEGVHDDLHRAVVVLVYLVRRDERIKAGGDAAVVFDGLRERELVELRRAVLIGDDELPARYSPNDAAEALSQVLGRQVTAKTVAREQWAALFEAQGTAPDRTALRIEMLDGFNSGWISFEGGAAARIQGTTTLKEAVQSFATR